jgi:hypothetical protein
VRSEKLAHTVVNEPSIGIRRETADIVNALMDLELAVDVVKDRPDVAFARNENRFTVIRV